MGAQSALPFSVGGLFSTVICFVPDVSLSVASRAIIRTYSPWSKEAGVLKRPHTTKASQRLYEFLRLHGFDSTETSTSSEANASAILKAVM